MKCQKCQATNDSDAVCCIGCGAHLQSCDTAVVSQTITIGRGDGNLLVVDHSQVSWEHARLSQDGQGQWWVEDLGSTNGTYVNNCTRKISRQQVSCTDVLYLGSHMILLDQVLTSQSQSLSNRSAAQGQQGSTITIGRGEVNDLILDYPQVSWEHARMFKDSQNQWWVEDLGSANGTYINDRIGKISRQQVSRTDVLYLGSFKIAVDRIISGHQGKTGHSIMLGGFGAQSLTVTPNKPLLIGRDPAADIHLDIGPVSWHHARLMPQTENQWLIEDLGSTNGTFVNGERVGKGKRLVRGGDEIGLGSYVFQLTPESRLQMRDLRGDFRLDARNVTVQDKKSGKMILNNISLSILPSEFVGLMGLSGAGKTTLFLAMNGYSKPTSGTSCLNGHDLYHNYDQFKNVIGYVPQKDVLHGELTVEETLYYAARLRLPTDTKDHEIYQRIDKLLIELDLINPDQNLDIRRVIIGTAIKKGISGGQLKRVNLAIELLADPGVLFLDEPTSGLSAVDNIMVMKLLRKLANGGKTIILVLHQPDIESYRLMDNVIILDQGELVYYGRCWPDSITFFNPDKEPQEVLERAEMALRGLAKQKAMISCRNRYEQSKYYKEYIADRHLARKTTGSSTNEKRNLQKSCFNFTHLMILTKRFLRCKLKDTMNTTILLAQAPVIAALISVVFNGQAEPPTTPLFMLVISALWLGTSNAAREIVCEFAIYERERMTGVGIPEYLLSKVSVLTGLCFFQCLMLVAITHTFVGIKAAWLPVFGITLLSSLVGLSMGLLLSSLARTSAAALALVPLAILPSVIVGGGLRSIRDMGDQVRWLSHIMPARWGYEALMQLESRQHFTNERLVEMLFGSHTVGLGWDCGILTGYALLLLLAAGIALKTRDNL